MRLNQEIVTADGDCQKRNRKLGTNVEESETPAPAVPRWTQDTPILVNASFISGRHDCIKNDSMARIYPPLGLLCFLFLPLLQSWVSAHMIEVGAGKKECFFEDLHKNDKVCMVLLMLLFDIDGLCIDDGDISSWRGRSSRYRFLGKDKCFTRVEDNERTGSSTARRPR